MNKTMNKKHQRDLVTIGNIQADRTAGLATRSQLLQAAALKELWLSYQYDPRQWCAEMAAIRSLRAEAAALS